MYHRNYSPYKKSEDVNSVDNHEHHHGTATYTHTARLGTATVPSYSFTSSSPANTSFTSTTSDSSTSTTHQIMSPEPERETAPQHVKARTRLMNQSPDADALIHNPYQQNNNNTSNNKSNNVVLTLVLDLDETLVSSRGHGGITHLRPGAAPFLRFVRDVLGCELVLWTAGEEGHAMRMLRLLDPSHDIFDHVVFRHERWCSGPRGRKDLSLLGRDLATTLIVENTPDCVRGHEGNAILVSDFYGHDLCPDDAVLDHLTTALRQVHRDVTTGVAKSVAEALDLNVHVTRRHIIRDDPTKRHKPLHLWTLAFDVRVVETNEVVSEAEAAALVRTAQQHKDHQHMHYARYHHHNYFYSVPANHHHPFDPTVPQHSLDGAAAFVGDTVMTPSRKPPVGSRLHLRFYDGQNQIRQ
eukprot:PhM_4_TR796/c0_g1_i1/m.86613